MAALDTLRDKWDGITPRERALVVLLGVGLIATLLFVLTTSITGKLDAMETNNAKMRRALLVLQDLRVRGTPDSPAGPEAQIGPTPLQLQTYLVNVGKRVGVEVSAVKPRTPQTKPNGYVTHTVDLQINNLTIEQVKSFLEAIETDNPLVAVTTLGVKRNFSDRQKLDVKLEVSTYSKPQADAAAGAGAGTAAPATPAAGTAP